MKKQINETLFELIIGIFLSGAVIEIGALLLTGYSGMFLSGLCIGLVTAAGLATHMYRSINYALDLQPDDAEKYMRRAYMIRAAAILVVAGIVTYFQLGYVVVTFVGMLCLKFGAFLQPAIHRILHGKKQKSTETDLKEDRKEDRKEKKM